MRLTEYKTIKPETQIPSDSDVHIFGGGLGLVLQRTQTKIFASFNSVGVLF